MTTRPSLSSSSTPIHFGSKDLKSLLLSPSPSLDNSTDGKCSCCKIDQNSTERRIMMSRSRDSRGIKARRRRTDLSTARKEYSMRCNKSSCDNYHQCKPCNNNNTSMGTLFGTSTCNADTFPLCASIDNQEESTLLMTPSSSENDTSVVAVRSQFYVERICCSSEIPAINSIVQPLWGVKKVMINLPIKTVYVDHNPMFVTAKDICVALNEEKFGAHIQKDGGLDELPSSAALRHHSTTTTTTSSSTFVESKLTIPSLRSELDAKALHTLLVSTFPKKQLRSCTVHPPSKTVKVEHNPYTLSIHSILQHVRTKWDNATILEDGIAEGTWTVPSTSGKWNKADSDDYRLVEKTNNNWATSLDLHVLLSGIFWCISMSSHVGCDWDYLHYVGLLSVALGLPSIAMKAIRTLSRFQTDANCMMFFAAMGALFLQEFTEAAAVTFLFALSDWLESRATARARNALSAIVRLRPDRANLVNVQTKEIVTVPATAVSVGDIVSVRTGDKVPCDGVIIEGQSTVDESSLTGESCPVWKCPGDTVAGGTINSGVTQLVIRTASTVKTSAVARLIRLVEEAQSNRSPTEKLLDEFAKRYTPIVMTVAVGMCTIPWAFGMDVGRTWTLNGLVTMVIACPCALIISTPVTYVAGLAATAQRGVLVKGGAHLEGLGLVKKIAFDKTGTLTESNFTLLHLNTVGGRRTRNELLGYLSLIESRSSHPLASALVNAARKEKAVTPSQFKSFTNHTILKGEGVMANVDGRDVYVGNARLFQRLGLFKDIPEMDKALAEEWAAAGGTVGFISIESEGIVGVYSVADAIRKESEEVVNALKKLDIDVLMLTGDNVSAACNIGRQVGLPPDSVRSQLLPEEKLQAVADLKVEDKKVTSALCSPFAQRRLVLMCGDGINDAPALATADVGVAMGAGAALAMETSDVTLMDSNLRKLVYSVEMGRRVIRTIKENVLFSLVTKAIVMGFTFAGKTTLWAAIATDVGAMLIVTLNGMKLLPSSKKKYDSGSEIVGIV